MPFRPMPAIALASLLGAIGTLAPGARPAEACPSLTPRSADLLTLPTQSGLSTSPTFLSRANLVYFSAFQTPNPALPSGGWTLWKSDGTPAGTSRVTMFATLAGATTFEQRLVASTPEAIWLTTSSSAARLWRSDGSDAGTVLINTPGSLSNPAFAALGSTVVFSDGATIRAADHTSTDAVALVTGPTGSGLFGGFAPLTIPGVGDRLAFSLATFSTSETRNDLYITDGTPSGTQLLRTFVYPANIFDAVISAYHPLGNRLYFTAGTAEEGIEIFRTDGTPTGTEIYADLVPGPSSWALTRVLGTAGGNVYVSILAAHLYAGTGVVGSLARIADANATPFISNQPPFLPMIELNGRGLFSANYPFTGTPTTPDFGAEPFLSNGTIAGSSYLADIRPGDNLGSFVDAAAALLNPGTPAARALFRATPDGSTTRLYSTDGTSAGTLPVASTITPTGTFLSSIGGRALLSASEPSVGTELYTADPLSATLVADINPGPGSSAPSRPFGWTDPSGNQRWIFAATNATTGREPWVTDTSTAGTHPLGDLAGGSISAQVISVGPAGNAAIFGINGLSPLPQALYRWTGGRSRPAALTAADANTPPATFSSVRTTLPAGDGRSYFVATSSAGGSSGALFITDGSAASTLRLTRTPLSTPPNIDFTNTAEQAGINGALLGTSLILESSVPGAGIEPVITDGTPAGTRLLKDVAPGGPPGNPSSSPRGFTTFANRVLFFANTPAAGTEPWVTDGTEAGTRLLADIAPGTNGSIGQQSGTTGRKPFAVFGSRAYFFATPSVNGGGQALYSTDGTPAGTAPVTLPAGLAISTISTLAATSRGLFFFGFSATLGDELYVIDVPGSAARLVKEIFPGLARVNTGNLNPVGNLVSFNGPSTPTGVVAWVSDGTAVGTRPVPLAVPGLGTHWIMLGGPVRGSRTYAFGLFQSPSGAALLAFDNDAPENACVIASATVGVSLSSATPPWPFAAVNSRLFLAPPDPTIGVEPAVVDLCPADFNNDGTRAPSDIFAFLDAYFAGSPDADTDGNANLLPADIFSFLKLYLAGGC